MNAPLTLWRNARLATFAGRSGWGLVQRGALLTAGAKIRWLGTDADLPARQQLGLAPDAEHDLQGALVTPGLIDAHTHLVYGATAPPSSSYGCRVPATKTSHVPAAASAAPWRPRVPPATTACSPARQRGRGR